MAYSVEAVFAAQDKISAVARSVNQGLAGMHTQATETRTALERLQTQHEQLAVRIKATADAMARSASEGRTTQAQWDRMNTTLRSSVGALSDVESKMRGLSGASGALNTLFGGAGGLAKLFGGGAISTGGGGGGIIGQLLGALSGGGLSGLGATLGSALGPVGTAIGGILGALTGAIPSAISLVGRAFGGLADIAMAPLRMIADAAGNLVGGAFNFLGGVIQYTLGGLLSSAVQGALGLLTSVATGAVSATAEMQAMQVGLESLLAREMARGTLTEKTALVTTRLTAKQVTQLGELQDTYTGLTNKIAINEAALARATGAKKVDELAVMRLNETLRVQRDNLGEVTAKIDALNAQNGKTVAVTTQVATGQMSLADALARAEGTAKALMGELAEMAILSPYQVENVQNTFKLAMAFGFASDEAKVFTGAILNTAAGVGATNEMMDRMGYNLAQIRMQNKVTAMDVRQLAMAGFDLNGVLRYVGEQMGVNIKTHEDFNKALDAGKVKWADFTRLFGEYADKNFGGAAERMSRTLLGLQSTFGDVFRLTLPQVVGPALEMLTGLLNRGLNLFLEIRKSGALEYLGKQFEGFAAAKLEPLDRLLKFFERFGELQKATSKGAPGRKGRGSIIGDLLDEEMAAYNVKLGELGAMTGGRGLLGNALEAAFGLGGAYDSVAAFVNDRVRPILEKGDFGPMAQAILDGWNKTGRPFLAGKTTQFFSWLSEPGGALDAAGAFVRNLLTGITQFIQNPPKDVAAMASAGGGVMGAIARVLFGGGGKVSPGERGEGGAAAGGLLEAVGKFFFAIIGAMTALLSSAPVKDGFAAVLGRMTALLSTLVVEKKDDINAFAGALTSFIVAAVNAVNWGLVIGAIATGLGGAFSGAMGVLGEGFVGWAGRNVSAHGAPGGNIPGRKQFGGYAWAGVPTMVGEGGPEIITPSRGGWVMPNSMLGNTYDQRQYNEFNITDPLTAAEMRDNAKRQQRARLSRGMQ